MTYAQIFEMLQELNIPVVYYQWTENSAPNLPYLIYYYPTSADEYAENVNYKKNNRLNVELYTEGKDFQLENQLERLLNQNGITYTRTESYLDTEQMYMTLLESEALINE